MDKGKKACYLVEDEDEDDDTVTKINEDIEVVFVVLKEDSEEEERYVETTFISKVRKNDTWIIDSGYTHHMTGDEEKNEYLEHYNGGSVKIRNDTACQVKGKGSILMNNKIRCENAYWVKGLNYNMLSVAQINNTGH